MKIWHISDTHNAHEGLIVPQCDMVIFSGDSSNPSNPYNNEPEVRRFITWFDSLPIKHKIYVAGNHDTSIEKGLVTKHNFRDLGIHYLENDFVIIEGLTIWGSPVTPTFGVGWSFNRDRSKIYKTWEHIPEYTDILVTHGPPKGILDKSFNRENVLEMCGDSALLKRVMKLSLKAHLFGHIHNNKEYFCNSGTQVLSGFPTIFSNGSCSTDGKLGEITSHGNILDI